MIGRSLFSLVMGMLGVINVIAASINLEFGIRGWWINCVLAAFCFVRAAVLDLPPHKET